MKFCSPYNTGLMKMDSLQRWILVQSIIYYELNKSIVSDKVFDKNCKDLVDLIRVSKYGEHKKTDLYYVFKDFDGSTGFYLYHNLCKSDKEKYMKEAIFALKVCK